MNSRLMAVLALVIIAAGLGWYLKQGGEQPEAPHGTALTAQSIEPEARAAIDSALGLLRTVKDSASADVVLPAIQASTTKLNAVAAAAAKLPAAQQDALAKAGTEIGEVVQKEITRIQAIPGVYDVLKPKMDRFLLMLNIINGKNYAVLDTLDAGQ